MIDEEDVIEEDVRGDGSAPDYPCYDMGTLGFPTNYGECGLAVDSMLRNTMPEAAAGECDSEGAFSFPDYGGL